jgi:hypothetical protein
MSYCIFFVSVTSVREYDMIRSDVMCIDTVQIEDCGAAMLMTSATSVDVNGIVINITAFLCVRQ